MSSLLNYQITYLTPALAAHYGLKYKGNGDLARHDLSKIPSRGGILTQGSVLTVGGDEASMVTRGLFVPSRCAPVGGQGSASLCRHDPGSDR